MDKPHLLILGTYEFAEEVADLVLDDGLFTLAGFVENRDRARCDRPIMGLPVHWVDDIAPLADKHLAVCAIGTTQRRAYTEQVRQMGFEFARVVHSSARVLPSTTIGAGCILSLGVIIASHSVLGEHVIVNRGAMIGHHTTVGSHVTISPGANIAGRVSIGDQVYVGMSATVINDRVIGDGAAVGAGSFVSRDVAAHTLVMGYPAVVAQKDIEPR